MGQSTDGQICYGINFDEGFEFPWNLADQSVEDWWNEVNGFKHTIQVFDDNASGYVGGKRPAESVIDAYYAEEEEFKKLHPCPVEEVNTCHADYPQYILALVGTCQTANRGCPEKFDPTKLVVTDEQKNSLIEFCKTHGIEFEGEPAWYLSSYWG